MSLMRLAARTARGLGVDTRRLYQTLSRRSIEAALAEQGLAELAARCRAVIPDISDQYTEGFDAGEYARYWEIKMRGLHAFQMRCLLDVVEGLGSRKDLVVVDIGDSSGNHGRYLRALAPAGRVARVVSVNLDPTAVEKVRRNGGEAVLCRAEELKLDHEPDLLTAFEMVGHLTDPTRFMHGLATRARGKRFLMTVPYTRRSRVSLQRIRGEELPDKLGAEGLSIFEFCPSDWLLLARFAGWRPIWTRRYLQYPRRSSLRVTAPLWRRLDFEGFWGVLFERDLSVADRYTDW